MGYPAFADKELMERARRLLERFLDRSMSFGGASVVLLPLALLLAAPLPASGASGSAASRPFPGEACGDLLLLPRFEFNAPQTGRNAPTILGLEVEGDYLERHAEPPSVEGLGGATGGNSGYIARANRVASEVERSGSLSGNLFFIDIENSVLKTLNDKVYGNKKVVDAIQNAFMEKLVRRIWSEPALQRGIDRAYSDYKSARFAGSADGEADKAERIAAFAAAYGDAVQAFVDEFENNELSMKSNGLGGPAGEPRNWFLAGWGGTADEANAAVRNARSVTSAAGTPLRSFEESKSLLRDRLIQVRRLSAGLDASLPPGSTVLSGHSLFPEGRRLLSIDAFELIRKIDLSRPDAAEAIRDSFRQRLKEEVTVEQAGMTRELFALVDGFSASLQIEERMLVDLSRAGEAGMLSVDFAGMGAVNLQETLAGLLQLRELDPTLAVRASRAAIGRGDLQMDATRKRWMDALTKVLGHRQSRRMIFSGDDGILLPLRPLSGQERDRLLLELSRSSASLRWFRIAFVPIRFADGREIPVIQRSRAIVTAESFEKDLKARLDVRVSRTVSNRLLFGIEYQPSSPSEGVDRGTFTVRAAAASKSGVVSERIAGEVEAAAREALPQGSNLKAVHWVRGSVVNAPSPHLDADSP